MTGIIKIASNYTQAWINNESLINRETSGERREMLIEGLERIGRVFTGDQVKLVKDRSLAETPGEGGAQRVQLVKGGDRRRGIVGILLLTSQQRFPANKRGVPRYQFQPLSRDLPEFLVASNLRARQTVVSDHYVIIDFQEWSLKQARPYGIIVQTLGAVGSYQAEVLARLHYREVYLPKIKLDQPTIAICRSLGQRLKHSGLVNRDDLEVFSIDPPGCRDIDDAFSCRPVRSGNPGVDQKLVVLGIHIADVNFCFECLGLDLAELVNRPSSVYLPDEVKHMLPEFVATNGASLRAGQLRPAVTIWWVIDRETGEILSERLDRVLITNRYAFSYDEVEFESNQTLRLTFEVSQLLAQRYLKTGISDWDAHRVIETLMIMSNWRMAQRLERKGLEGIYRVHNSSETTELPENLDQNLAQALKQLRMESAEYTEEPGSHWGLNLPIYTHFTSPIRRLVDIMVHRKLLELEPIEIDLDLINDFNRRVKRLERDLTWLKLMELARVDSYLEVSASLIAVRESRLVFYLDLTDFPEIDSRFRLMETRVVPEELEHLFEFEVSDQQLKIRRKSDGQSWEFEFAQPIQIKLYAHPKVNQFNQKLGLEIAGFSEFLK